MAELMLRSWADPRADLRVSSAGMRALVGHEIDHGSASAVGQLAIDPTRHRARQFEPWMASDADLVLTAERAHRDEIMTQVPTAFRRIYTIKEFARLALYIDQTDAHSAVIQVAAVRSTLGAVPLVADDLADPYRQTVYHATAIAHEVTAAVKTTLDVLGFSTRRMRPYRPRPHAL